MIYNVMQAHGDGAKQVYLTEFGRWVCADSPTRGCVDEATQARFVTESYAYLRRYPFLRGAFWFSDWDYATELRRYGLRTEDLTKRQSFWRFRTEAVNWRILTGWQ